LLPARLGVVLLKTTCMEVLETRAVPHSQLLGELQLELVAPTHTFTSGVENVVAASTKKIIKVATKTRENRRIGKSDSILMGDTVLISMQGAKEAKGKPQKAIRFYIGKYSGNVSKILKITRKQLQC